MQEIENLLKSVGNEIQLINTSKRLYEKQLAPNFSIFDYISTNETNLSYILADLLNPKGSHHQGDLFLKNFINTCLPNLQCQEWREFLDNLPNISIDKEVPTRAIKSYRRMDIYLTDDKKYGICIENKPYAIDQPDQLNDYYQELDKKHLYKHLVYLSQEPPTENSVKKEMLDKWQFNNEFSHITFGNLIDWLNNCKAECQNISVLEFINQFIKFIQKQFMGVSDMNEQNAIINKVLESNENIVSAIKIANQVPILQKMLIEKLNKQLTEKINQNPNYQLYQNKSVSLNEKRYSGFYVKVKDCNLYIAFEFDNGNYNNLIMGYKSLDKNLIKGNDIYDKVAKEIVNSLPNKKIKTSEIWFGWYYLEDIRYDWRNNPDIWAGINDGSLADRIMQEIDELYENVVKNNIKIEL